MKPLSRGLCEQMAQEILDEYKIKNSRLFEHLVNVIRVRGSPPVIRIYWDSKIEDLTFEVLK